MNSKLKTELFKAAVLTFEELGFLLPNEEIEECQQNAQAEATVSVEFQGPFRGKLVVTVCGGLLPILAANMLGEELVPSERQQLDALGEIANVICGNMLPGIAGPKEVFQVGAPQLVESADSLNRNRESLVAEVQVGLEQGRAELKLFLDSDAIQYFKERAP
ncbi:MAG: chemotaxis protein CheX [candidate division KSB1 bacterium]|nr:chemotaxis protein CheX [candidate division KSB1 bacterium]